MHGTNKLLALVGGEPVLIRTLLTFDKCPQVDEIVVSVKEDNLNEYAALIGQYDLKKVTKIVVGGKTRLESVYNAALACSAKADYIMVHDAARPLISETDIVNVYNAIKRYNSAAAGRRISDTVKTIENTSITGTLDRDNLICVQTPQGADRDLLVSALKNAFDKKLKATDECMALEALSVKPHFVETSAENMKITFDVDLFLANAIYNRRHGKCE